MSTTSAGRGWCSIVLGAALAVVAFPGLIVSYGSAWAGLLFAPALLLALGLWARLRHGVAFARPGAWLTSRPLAGAREGVDAVPAARLRRRLALETTVWIVAVGLWVVLAGSSGLLVFGTGLASIAFGAVQAFGGSGHVASGFPGRPPPGLGAPELSVSRG